jgi:hypothetical protein
MGLTATDITKVCINDLWCIFFSKPQSYDVTTGEIRIQKQIKSFGEFYDSLHTKLYEELSSLADILRMHGVLEDDKLEYAELENKKEEIKEECSIKDDADAEDAEDEDAAEKNELVDNESEDSAEEEEDEESDDESGDEDEDEDEKEELYVEPLQEIAKQIFPLCDGMTANDLKVFIVRIDKCFRELIKSGFV